MLPLTDVYPLHGDIIIELLDPHWGEHLAFGSPQQNCSLLEYFCVPMRSIL